MYASCPGWPSWGGHESTPVKYKHILLLCLGAFTVSPFPDFLYEAFTDYCMVKDAPRTSTHHIESSSAGCDIATIISFSFSLPSSFCSRKDGYSVSRFTSHQWDKKNAAAMYGYNVFQPSSVSVECRKNISSASVECRKNILSQIYHIAFI